jgi:hypothetical protein
MQPGPLAVAMTDCEVDVLPREIDVLQGSCYSIFLPRIEIMRNAIACALMWLILLITMALTACSNNEGTTSQRSELAQLEAADLDLKSYGIDARDALRARKDPQRNRLWLLSWDDVRVYDTATKALIQRIVLPTWSVAACIWPPDLALDQTGSALIASNAHPVIARIDVDSFALDKMDIALTGREQWDMGFGALAFGQNGALFALTSVGNALWTVDLAAAKATLVTLYEPPLVECMLPLPAVDG